MFYGIKSSGLKCFGLRDSVSEKIVTPQERNEFARMMTRLLFACSFLDVRGSVEKDAGKCYIKEVAKYRECVRGIVYGPFTRILNQAVIVGIIPNN